MENEKNYLIHRVEKGETLYKLAKYYGARLIDILKENPYVDVYNLQPGDEIKIPLYIEHEDRSYITVKNGQTFGDIINELDINVELLFGYNKELYDVCLEEGRIVRIPDGK